MKSLKSQKNKKNFFQSFVWAAQGIKECFIREINFRFHIFMTVLVSLFSFIFKVEKMEFVLLLFCILTVLTSELVNTLTEEICNSIDENYNDKIKYIKDLAAGMVLISAIFSAVIGLIIFVPYLIQFIEKVL